MLYETLLVAIACAHVSALVFIWQPPPAAMAHWPLMQYRTAVLAVTTVGATLLVMAAPWLTIGLARWTRSSPQYPSSDKMTHPHARTVIACYLLYVFNFVLVGVGLAIVARSLSGAQGSPTAIYCIGAFASSWILGFLAPGAPAGLGVRESALLLWFGGVLQSPDAIALILLLRVATTLGDLVTFGWGSILLARLTRHRRRPPLGCP